MPRSRSNAATNLSNARQVNLFSNIFEIKLKGDKSALYQYHLDISPEVPAESHGLIDRITKSIGFELRKMLGLMCSRGLTVWGSKELKTVLTC